MARKKKPAEEESDNLTPKVERIERWEDIELHRSEIKNAPYNPRKIGAKQKDKLKEVLRQLGMLGPIIWNKRSGNIVGGHQRMKLTDDYYGTQDYKIRVAAVDLSDKQEMEANIALNNAEAQGDWDIGQLGEMFKQGLDVGATGFAVEDVYRLFGEDPNLNVGNQAAVEEVVGRYGDMVRRLEARIEERADTSGSPDFYLVIVFKDQTDRDKFCQSVGWTENRYQSGEELKKLARGEKRSNPA